MSTVSDFKLRSGIIVSGGNINTGTDINSLLFSTTTTGNISIASLLTSGTFTIGSASSTGNVSLFPATGGQTITLGGSTTGSITIGSTSASAINLPTGKTKVGATTLIQGSASAISITFPSTTGTLTTTSNKISDFAACTSAELAGKISDETGTGVLVFATSPTFVTSVITSSATLAVFNTVATTVNAFGAATALSIAAGTGTTTINNSLTVAGNLIVNGTTTTVNSTTVTIDDPIFTLGGDTAGLDDAKDRGIEFKWHNGTAAKVGFFGFDDSTGYFTFIADATNTSEVFAGTLGDFQATNFRGSLIGNADSATSAGKSTNLVGGNSTTLLGSIPYQSNTDTTTLLAPNTTTTRKFLRQTGTGTNGAAPVWDTITTSDLGSGTANSTTYLRGDSTWQTISGGITLADDVSTNAVYYPLFSTTATPGSISTVDVSSTKLNFNPSTGNLSSTLFTSLSDISKKTNITSIINALDVVSKLKPVNFNWIENNKPSIGVIAQQLEEVLPELVETDILTGLKSVNYDGLIGILIAAIQELINKKEI